MYSAIFSLIFVTISDMVWHRVANRVGSAQNWTQTDPCETIIKLAHPRARQLRGSSDACCMEMFR